MDKKIEKSKFHRIYAGVNFIDRGCYIGNNIHHVFNNWNGHL